MLNRSLWYLGQTKFPILYFEQCIIALYQWCENDASNSTYSWLLSNINYLFNQILHNLSRQGRLELQMSKLRWGQLGYMEFRVCINLTWRYLEICHVLQRRWQSPTFLIIVFIIIILVSYFLGFFFFWFVCSFVRSFNRLFIYLFIYLFIWDGFGLGLLFLYQRH